eukprot:10627218-Karenia_brevis.AAC.1
MEAADLDTVMAMSSTSTARLIKSAATEFTMRKTWELLQYPALKHKKLGAEAKEASDNLQA